MGTGQYNPILEHPDMKVMKSSFMLFTKLGIELTASGFDVQAFTVTKGCHMKYIKCESFKIL